MTFVSGFSLDISNVESWTHTQPSLDSVEKDENICCSRYPQLLTVLTAEGALPWHLPYFRQRWVDLGFSISPIANLVVVGRCGVSISDLKGLSFTFWKVTKVIVVNSLLPSPHLTSQTWKILCKRYVTVSHLEKQKCSFLLHCSTACRLSKWEENYVTSFLTSFWHILISFKIIFLFLDVFT